MATLFAIAIKLNIIQCNSSVIDLYFYKDSYVEFLTLSARFLFNLPLESLGLRAGSEVLPFPFKAIRGDKYRKTFQYNTVQNKTTTNFNLSRWY